MKQRFVFYNLILWLLLINLSAFLFDNPLGFFFWPWTIFGLIWMLAPSWLAAKLEPWLLHRLASEMVFVIVTAEIALLTCCAIVSWRKANKMAGWCFAAFNLLSMSVMMLTVLFGSSGQLASKLNLFPPPWLFLSLVGCGTTLLLGLTLRMRRGGEIGPVGQALCVSICCLSLGTAWLARDPMYVVLGSFKDGFARAEYRFQEFGWVNSDGMWAIRPRFVMTQEFSEGLAAVAFDTKKNLYEWSYINQKGEVTIAGPFDFARSFSEGLAAVQVGGRFGFVDRRGTWVIRPQFERALDFSQGLAAVRAGRQWGYVDQSGTGFFDSRFMEAGAFSEGLAPVLVNVAFTEEKKDPKFGYIDKTGVLLIPARFSEAHRFHSQRALVAVSGMYGYIDSDGKWIVQPKFVCARDFSEGLASVEIDGRVGYIDREGHQVIAPQFNSAENFLGGRARVRQANGSYGYIDRAGRFTPDQPSFKKRLYGWRKLHGVFAETY